MHVFYATTGLVLKWQKQSKQDCRSLQGESYFFRLQLQQLCFAEWKCVVKHAAMIVIKIL